MAKKRKRSNGEGTIYPGEAGKWIAQISCRVNGKLIRPKRTCKKHADAVVKLEELRRLAKTLDMSEQGHTVASYLKQWIGDEETTELSKNSYVNYLLTINKHITPQIGNVKLSELKAPRIRKMISDLRKCGTGSRTVALSYVILNIALNQAFLDDIIPKNPCISVARPKHNREDIIPFTRDERKKIFDQADGMFFYPLYRFMLSTGVRGSEAFGLKWDDIDYKSKTIHIQRQYNRGEYKPLKTKHSDRRIDMTPCIENYLKLQKDLLKKHRFEKNEHVFCAIKGGLIRGDKHGWKYWNPLLRKAGVSVRGLHHLRHTFASELLADDADLLVVSKLLGHSSPVVTLNIYGHVMPPKRSQVAGKIEVLFS